MNEHEQNPMKPNIVLPETWDAEKDQDYFRCIHGDFSEHQRDWLQRRIGSNFHDLEKVLEHGITHYLKAHEKCPAYYEAITLLSFRGKVEFLRQLYHEHRPSSDSNPSMDDDLNYCLDVEKLCDRILEKYIRNGKEVSLYELVSLDDWIVHTRIELEDSLAALVEDYERLF